MAKLLRAVNLGKSYNGRRVVRDVSFEIERGKVVGILGPNGAGKTTAFYMIAGLVHPDYGSVFMDDDNITDLPIYMRSHKGLAYLPQESSIFRGLSVEDNIKAILEISYHDEEEREHMLEELLANFSISHLRKSPSIALSGGERRRLEIARALASKPKFILLDEPLAGVDPIAVNDIKSLIRNLTAKGIGVVITDHNVREALSILDYTYVVHDGEILAQGKPNQIVKDKNVKKNYLGENFTI